MSFDSRLIPSYKRKITSVCRHFGTLCVRTDKITFILASRLLMIQAIIVWRMDHKFFLIAVEIMAAWESSCATVQEPPRIFPFLSPPSLIALANLLIKFHNYPERLIRKKIAFSHLRIFINLLLRIIFISHTMLIYKVVKRRLHGTTWEELRDEKKKVNERFN